MRSPNILLIILDTLRRDRLSLYGSSHETSPRLDDFAARSHVFTRAVAPSHWTIPAHASIFTGEYPSAHGMTQGNHLLTDRLPTLAEHLTAAGYHTVGFCNNPLVGVLLNGLQRGFGAFYNYAGAVPNRPADDQSSDTRRRFLRWFRPHARRIAHGFSQSDWLFRVSLHPALTPIWTRYVNFKGNTDLSLRDALDYWNAQTGDQPLFMFVNLMGAHLPYHPPADLLPPGTDRRAFAFMNRLNRDSAAWASPRETPLADWQTRTLLDFYDAEIAAQDRALGHFLEALAQRGHLDDTLIVIAADHGECHGEHELFGHTFDVHQELVHVPLILHHPDERRGGTIPANVSTRRLYHTLLQAAGVRVENRSLLPLLENGADPEGGIAFSEAVAPRMFLQVIEHSAPALIERLHLRETRRAVYQGDYKLILRENVVEGLYNVADDSTETRDLAAVEPDRAAALRAHLEAFTRREQSADAAQIAPADDEVIEHLRALGYIE
jgi:arylsulfatase A-like enzyme